MQHSYSLQKNTTQVASFAFIAYTESEIKALSLGYLEVQDDRGCNRRYFIKDGKKWIHNIEALRRKLNGEFIRYIDDEELGASAPEGFGYDVEAYYLYNSNTNMHQLNRLNVMRKMMKAATTYHYGISA